MVEFGLKLEDNKVEEWAAKYIDYEKLKSLIKKAKKAAEARDALVQRRPEVAAEVKSAFDSGLHPELIKHGSFSDPHLNRLGDSDDESLKFAVKDKITDDASCGSATTASKTRSVGESEISVGVELPRNDREEKTSLLDRNLSNRYGAQSSCRGLKTAQKQGSFRSIESAELLARSDSNISLSGAMERIKGYFRGNYVSKLAEAMQEVDVRLVMFSKCIHEEIEKVNGFYDERVDEYQQRLEVLVESVGDRKPKGDSRPNNRRRSLTDRDKFVKLKSVVTRRLVGVIPSGPQDADVPYSGRPVEYLPDEEHETGRVDKKQQIKEADSIKRELNDLHRRATLLLNFSIMNYTGFVKIVKKYGKSFPERKGQFSDLIKKDGICHEGKESEKLVSRMEGLYAKWFCDDNIREARAQMLPKRGDGLSMDWSQLRLGYRMGMCSILALWVCWDCIWGLVTQGHTTIGGRTAFPVFRACGGLLLLHWFWGASVYIWTRYRINYIFLFDFNPRIVDTPLHIFNETVDETLVFFSLMLLYYKSGAHDMPEVIPAGGYPFLLVLYTGKKLIFPWRTRAPLWKAIWEVVSAPIYSPTFFHTYVGDIFTSMVKVFQDILWALCFVFSGDFLLSEDRKDDTLPHPWQHAFWYKNVVIPLICLAPLWFRFNQCLRRYLDTGKRWPNLANAFKYAMSQTVTLFGTFHPLYMLHMKEMQNEAEAEAALEFSSNNVFQCFWIGLFISSSLYSFTWDVYMDWGLGKPRYGFLGPRLMFPNRLHYYGVVVIDLALRFMWVSTLIPPQSGISFELPQYLTALTMALELMRRTLWGFFRLEHEHRHNTEGYRRVDFVPLHFSTGHDHKYKKDKERIGWHVLAEVFTVSAVVIAISVTSVIAAQKATLHTKGEL